GRATGQEGPAAPPEHDRAEHGAEPAHAREVDGVAEPVHDHLAGHDKRDRQGEAEPEAAAEDGGVVAGVLAVTGVLAVAATRGLGGRALTGRGVVLAVVVRVDGGRGHDGTSVAYPMGVCG